MGHIFISYSHKDTLYVRKLADALRQEGFEVWVDDRIDYGTTWPIVIQKNLDACSAFIVVMTETAYESKWVHNEVTRAERKQKPFFALLLSGDTWLSLEAIQYENVTGGKLPSHKFYESLARVAPRSKETVPPPPRPAPSLSPKPREQKDGLAKRLATSIFSRVFPYRRIIGFSGIVFVLLGLILWGIPKFSAPEPTATSTLTQSSSVTRTVTYTSVASSTTTQPKATSTKAPTHTPTALPPEIVDAQDVPMNLIAGGKFIMGNTIEKAMAVCQKFRSDCEIGSYMDETPPHSVDLSAFYIDRYEVSNKQYKVCVDAGACDSPTKVRSYTRPNYYESSKYDDYPVLYVNWEMSQAYCEWRGARLPTEAEWEKAARGTDQRPYSWGESISCDFANYWIDDRTCVGDTAPVENYPLGKSPYGVFNLAGNVAEWVADWYQGDYYSVLAPDSLNPTGPSSGLEKVARGGSWNSMGNFVQTTSRLNRNVLYASDGIGFRCAKDAPP